MFSQDLENELSVTSPQDIETTLRYARMVGRSSNLSPWRRRLLSVFLDILIFFGPLLTDEVVEAWQEANKMRSTVGLRFHDIYLAINGYVMMYVRAACYTSRRMASLYGKALRVTITTLFK